MRGSRYCYRAASNIEPLVVYDINVCWLVLRLLKIYIARLNSLPVTKIIFCNLNQNTNHTEQASPCLKKPCCRNINLSSQRFSQYRQRVLLI
jgi:hypothetical protein